MPFKNPHPLYSAWQGMRRRCLTPTYKQWSDYGGRGIRICPEWDSFVQFVADIGPKPGPGYSLDKIDNDGDYTPANCRWATRKEQQRNRRKTRHITIEGKQYLLAELAELADMKPESIEQRAAKGLNYDQVVAKTIYVNRSNWRRAVAVRVRNQRNATHCKHGHPWTPENTRITPQGWKNCRICHKLKMRKRMAAANADDADGRANGALHS